MSLEPLQFSPAGTVQDGMNVFMAEAKPKREPGEESTTTAPFSELAPGMEGFAHLEVGQRRVWWVLSHRIMNWFRLRFWV